jgi:hypothetical protein
LISSTFIGHADKGHIPIDTGSQALMSNFLAPFQNIIFSIFSNNYKYFIKYQMAKNEKKNTTAGHWMGRLPLGPHIGNQEPVLSL